jgi:iron complex outermembrane receptor protein
MRIWLPSTIRLLVAGSVVLVVPELAAGQAPQSEPADAKPPAETSVLPPVPPAPPGDIESIEITGEREETSVQDEAEAVTRFGMEDLDKLNISNVDGLAANVPGLHVGQQGQAAIVTLRGIGTENASITGESGVAFHVDGIYFARPTAARVAFYDIRLIDVKRGPQGLLGGKNSTSGSINVETNDPSQEYELQGDVLLGNYDRVRSRGTINIPFGEIAAFRTAVFYEARDGYLDNRAVSDSRDPFDADNFGFRSKLRITPTDSLDLVLGYNYFKETGNGPQADLVSITKSELNCGPPADPSNFPGNAVFPPVFQFSPPQQSGFPRNIACGKAPVFLSDENGQLVRNSNGTLQTAGEVYVPASEESDPRQIYTDRLAAQDDRYWGTHAHLTWDVPEIPLLGATQVDLRGGYQRTENGFAWDFDSTDSIAIHFPLETSSLSHEHVADARWSGTALDERFEWQTSFFFARERADALNVTEGFSLDEVTGTGSSTDILTEQSVENKSYGAALHGAYQISDAITFKLAGRWIKDHKRSYLSRLVQREFEACVGREGFNVTELPDGGLLLPALLPECELTDRGTTWGSALEWRPADGHLLYIGIDRGFKSAGFQLGGVGEYGSEKIWAYSAGSKSELFDGRLQLNLEGFFYRYYDMQIALIDGTAIRTENADARMYGLELEANAEPMQGLRLGAVLGHLKTETLDYPSLDPSTLGKTLATRNLNARREAERLGRDYSSQTCFTNRIPGTFYDAQGRAAFKSVRCGAMNGRVVDSDGSSQTYANGLVDYSGNELSRSPKWKATLRGEYEIPLGRFGSLTPHVQYTWQDDTYFRAFNEDFDVQEAYHKTDAKLLWQSLEQRWSAELFVENIEDEAVIDYLLIGSRAFQSPPLAWYNAPRFYGVRLGFRY